VYSLPRRHIEISICGLGILLSEDGAILKEMRKSIVGLSIYLFCDYLINFSLFISTVKLTNRLTDKILQLYPCLHGNLQTDTSKLIQCYRPVCR